VVAGDILLFELPDIAPMIRGLMSFDPHLELPCLNVAEPLNLLEIPPPLSMQRSWRNGRGWTLFVLRAGSSTGTFSVLDTRPAKQIIDDFRDLLSADGQRERSPRGTGRWRRRRDGDEAQPLLPPLGNP